MTDLATNPEIAVEVDRELLEEAQRQISATSSNAVINEALRRLVEEERARRRRALERTQQMADEGLLDFRKLDDVDRCESGSSKVVGSFEAPVAIEDIVGGDF